MSRKNSQSIVVMLLAVACLMIGFIWKPVSASAANGENPTDAMAMYGINRVNGSLMRYDFGSNTLQT